MSAAGIYVHIPYCKVKCHYCDFHFSTNSDRANEMIDTICTELLLRSEELSSRPIETIYFGGGTPSLMTASDIEQVLNTIHKHYSVSPNAEITIECNPDDLNKNTLMMFKSAGINRLSIGIQSFNNEVLQLMNRAHNADEALASVYIAKEVGFENITVDLIYGVPSTDMDYWKKQLDIFLELEIPHLSSYCLTIEPKTVFDNWVKKDKISLPSDELSKNQFEYLKKTLEENDFQHYEISNFAKNGYLSQHNTAYWLSKHYMGVGPSAHSYSGGKRRWNISNNPQYIKRIQDGQTYYETEELSSKDKLNDYILTRLRTIWGIDLDEVKKIGSELQLNDFYKAINKHIELQNLLKKDQKIVLSNQGMFIADYISADLFI